MSRWMVGGIALVAFGCERDEPVEPVQPPPGSPPFTTYLPIDGGDESDPDSFGTELCVAGTGADAVVYAIWLDDRANDDGRLDIWMNRSLGLGSPGSWWEEPVKVNAGDPAVASTVWNPDLYCDELGVFVVWEDSRDGVLDNHQIYFNRSLDLGATFLAEDLALEVDPDGLTMSLEPKITGSGEELVVTWYDGPSGAYDILAASSSDGGATWRLPARVDLGDPAGSHYSARPEVAVSEGGVDVWVLWEDARDGASDIWFARSDDHGTSFVDQQRLDGGDAAGASDSLEPVLCAGGEGLYAVWHDARDGDGRDIYFNYSADGGATWLPAAQRLDGGDPGSGNSLFPVCVADGDAAHVAWYDQRVDEGGYDIWYTRIDGGVPSAPIRIDQGWPDAGEPEGHAHSFDPRIALEGDVVAVAWSDLRGEATAAEPSSGYNDLFYNYSEDGGVTFQAADLRIDSMYTGTSYKKDLNFELLGGSWLAAWTDGRSGTTDIYFESMAIGEQAEPPTLP